MRAIVVALAAVLVALWSTPARAHVESRVLESRLLTARLTMPDVAHREDSRLGLQPTFVSYIYRGSDASPRLVSGNPRLTLRLAKDPLLLTIDEFRFHDATTTLWGWPGQNPLRWSDPMGRNRVHVAPSPLDRWAHDAFDAAGDLWDFAGNDYNSGNYFAAQFHAGLAVDMALIGAAFKVGPAAVDLLAMASGEGCPTGARPAPPRVFPNLDPGGPFGPPRTFPPASIRGSQYNGRMNYVVRESGELVIGRPGHDTLAGRGDGVLAAGEVNFVGGEVRSINNESGHYQPYGPGAQQAAEGAFEAAGFNARGKYSENER